MAVGAGAESVALRAFLLNAAWAIADRVDRCFLILFLTVAISGAAWARDMPATVLIEVAGRFQHDGVVDELLDRLGAASQYTSISYWSWSRQRWRNLFDKSVALSAPERSAERQDFKADGLQKGDQVLILQDESGSVGEVIQRVSIIDRTDDRIEIGVTNVTPARIVLITLFGPGGSDMRLWIEREAEDRWTYYSLTRLSGADLLARPTLERSYGQSGRSHVSLSDRRRPSAKRTLTAALGEAPVKPSEC